jgi:UDP-N-acetylmuramate dehydrogenase
MAHSPTSTPLSALRSAFGDRLQENVVMANYTTANVGGPVDAMLILHTSTELENAARRLWEMNVPFQILGAGSNVLASDAGIRGVVLINHARNVKIDAHSPTPSVWAESGANLGGVARQVVLRGLSGLEWAGSIPGTVGGAVYGNAGANGGDTAGNLLLAEILHQSEGRVSWPVERLEYSYRSSSLKRRPGQCVILAARLKLSYSQPDDVQLKMDGFNTKRRQTQPPGASMGSMFKNPPGDYAGRLIEAAGLKGTRVGGAEISSIHANFFVTHDRATAADIMKLIELAQKKVHDQFGIKLELEIEILGEWKNVRSKE